MSARRTGRVLRTASAAGAGGLALVVAGAGPAAAHDVGAGSLPAPPWLLSYLGAFAVLAAALALRATWPVARLAGRTAEAEARGGAPIRLGVGHAVGTALFALVLGAAVVGPDTSAANIAPVAVLVVWWVGLPLVTLLVGDVMRVANPFVAVVRLLERGRDEPPASRPPAPTWVPAAFLATFGWFLVAYHRPGSPRALAVLLVVYALAAIGLGLRWGSRWLSTGEGFGALSAAVSTLAPIRRSPLPAGTAPLMLVWVGSTAFDGVSSTQFWADVVGSSVGWERTAFNTVGLVWLTAVAAGVYLGALRAAALMGAGRGDRATADATSLADPLGGALVPVALGWFVAHDLTFLLFEGQNFITLLSDPIGRGWDLVGSISHTVDYDIVRARWVAWLQLVALFAGHLAAVVLAHDLALRQLRPRAALRVTWAMAAASAASIVGACLLVLG
jgi:hypothetical protein